MDASVLSLLGGGLSGFIFKLIGNLVSAQQERTKMLLSKQEASDISHDKASVRGGVWVRRGIVATILFAVVIAPFIISFTEVGITIPVEKGMFFWKKTVYETLSGLLVHQSVYDSLYCIIGFYFGSSTISRK